MSKTRRDPWNVRKLKGEMDSNVPLELLRILVSHFWSADGLTSKAWINVSTLCGFLRVSKETYMTFVLASFYKVSKRRFEREKAIREHYIEYGKDGHRK